MSLGNVAGTIGTVVGLGVTIGALGLALNFTQRAFDQVPRGQGQRRRQSKPVFDTRGADNMFSFGGSQRRSQPKRRKNDAFASELFNF